MLVHIYFSCRQSWLPQRNGRVLRRHQMVGPPPQNQSLICDFPTSCNAPPLVSPAACPSDDNAPTKGEQFPPYYSTSDLVHQEPEEENDPWDLPELKDTGVKWSGEAAGTIVLSTASGLEIPTAKWTKRF